MEGPRRGQRRRASGRTLSRPLLPGLLLLP